MKDLHNYLLEKLKLSDINPDNLEDSLDGGWVDAKDLKNIFELKEGNLVKTKNGSVFLVVKTFLANDIIKVISNYPLVMFRFDYEYGTADAYTYMPFESYDSKYPKTNLGLSAFEIVSIKPSKKKYTSVKEIEKTVVKLSKEMLNKI